MPPSAIVSSEFFALAIYHFLQEAVSRSRKFRSTTPLTQSYAAAASETRRFPGMPHSRVQHEVTCAPHVGTYCLEGYGDRLQLKADRCRLKYRTKQDMDDLSGADGGLRSKGRSYFDSDQLKLIVPCIRG